MSDKRLCALRGYLWSTLGMALVGSLWWLGYGVAWLGYVYFGFAGFCFAAALIVVHGPYDHATSKPQQGTL